MLCMLQVVIRSAREVASRRILGKVGISSHLPRSYGALATVLKGSNSGNGDGGSSSRTRADGGLLSLPLAIGALLSGTYVSQKSESCGIIAVVGSEDARSFLIEGLTILRNRGYDSAGMASVNINDGLLVSKYASRDTTADSIDLLNANSLKHKGHRTGIAHTRWATHGGKTDQNAHPHTDWKGRVAIVHNGTINNSHELRKELIGLGIPFASETDTEV